MINSEIADAEDVEELLDSGACCDEVKRNRRNFKKSKKTKQNPEPTTNICNVFLKAALTVRVARLSALVVLCWVVHGFP